MADIMRWCANELEAKGPTGGDPDTKALRKSKLKEEVRKLRAQANTAEREDAKSAGTLLDSAEVTRLWANVARVVRHAVEGIGARVAARCVGRTAAEIQGIIDEECRDALQHLSKNAGEEIQAAA